MFDAHAGRLLKAMDISEAVIAASRTFTARQKDQMGRSLAEMRGLVENPAPQFRNPRSLAFIEQAVVQPWNETGGADADAFWAAAASAGLDFQRGKTLREPR